MASVKSVDFLPEIFQTDANKQFLAATLDQLIQEPNFKKIQGFIGRTVGPGVNPNDRYVIEPDKTRAVYQLEPGVVNLKPDTDTIKDAITYPGMNDAVSNQGGDGGRPDRLYSSEYYSWDPFVNFDTFVNFSQYFWVPDGPPVVDVASTEVPLTDNFVVTRANGVYTFSGLNGDNPTIELVRGGNYTFQVAQNKTETVNYRVGNNGATNYIIDGEPNPNLTLIRGNTYVFNITLSSGVHPFWIKTAAVTGTGQSYNSGVTQNGSVTGLVTFTVPQDAPDTLYYVAQDQIDMQGMLTIVNGTPDTGSRFWIQAAPGISGTMPATPNISSRDVYGVTDNGTDLGTVLFNVPEKTAQNFYYDLDFVGQTDLLTNMKFNEINGQPLIQFIIDNNGIDGITDLNGKTVVITNTEESGWTDPSLVDPVIPFDDRYQVWKFSYVTVDSIQYINLTKITTVNQLTRFSIRSGNVYANTQWYKDQNGFFKEIPLLTAAQDTLYYQDSTDPEIFGMIKLLAPVDSNILDITDIIGKKNYTSPNGVVFTNGLKVKFTGDVTPVAYRSGTSTLSYSETEANSNYITSLTANTLYVNQEIIFPSPTLGGLNPGQSYYVRSIAANGLKFTVSETVGGPAFALSSGQGNPADAIVISNRQYYVAGVGTAIELLPVSNFYTPESYTTGLDYLTIDRASKDLNPWTRSNRWFHIDVINAAYAYNNSTAVLDNNYRAKRPVIEFRPGIRLWNMGTEGKAPVNIIDFTETDAFSNIEGQTSYTTDGYSLVEGSRVIFAADEDADVRNKIYVVSFATPDTIPPLIAQPIIVLTEATDGTVLLDDSTVVLNGNTEAGNTYWYDGTTWTLAQQKTAVQQAPLYNIYDPAGISFGDQIKYQSSTFTGSKLFSYAVGDTTILDPVLQFPLKYLNINNVGDILFDNNLYVDTFLYVKNNVSTTSDISSGNVREYADRTVFKKMLGWQTAVVDQQIYQQFKFSNPSGTTLKLDIAAIPQTSIAIPVIKIYVGSKFQDPTTYSYVVPTANDSTIITLNNAVAVGEVIEVLVLSNQTSKVGFYQVANNLQNNPLNANSPAFTLGTIRTHYQSIGENLTNLVGPISGANNTRDLGDIVPYGLVILQQSSPLTLAGYFLRSKDYNIFASLQFNSREYIKYKAQLMDAVIQQNIQFQTAGEILDAAIQDLTLGKVENQPFYWTDMLPFGVTSYSNSYTVNYLTRNIFDTVQVYDYKSSNYLGLLVYLNGVLLTRGIDYVVATDGPRLTINLTLNVGDVVLINEYTTTYGNFVPNTPTKLGLYPAWRPAYVEQVTSNGTVTMLQGHDGSITPLFNDIRDEVLLEFETRIYSNLKHDDNPVPLTFADVLPGQFRDTGYTFAEINSILGKDLLSYCGWNKLDYKPQDYAAGNEFTWNYSSATNKLNNQNLLGAWRGIYRYFYDTQQPSLTPWEMLGFSVEPVWWQDQYGAAPYTQDNLVLWDDLAAGYVADPVAPYYLPEYARPGLLDVLPTGTQGELLSPFASVVSNFDAQQFRKSWAIGDGGPVEASWWNSSGYPFAVMHALAVTRPAKFFALFADRDLYKYNTDYNQYLFENRYRLNANQITVYGNGTSKASYINWIVDFNRQTGIDSTYTLQAELDFLDVRLCYRMAGYSDKQYIKLYTEKSSPNSTNTALLIPDESYNLLLYKNQPFDRTIYSSIAIQKVDGGGYAVFGYSNQQPYFNILQSSTAGKLQTYSVSGLTIQVPTFYTNNVVEVPYGFVFESPTSVADFLLSYGKFLERQGMTFTDIANGYVLDWPRMVSEFMYWSQQGWGTDAIINLNPLASKFTISKPMAIVDTLQTQTAENSVLNQNNQEFPTRNLNIVRVGNTFTVEPLDNNSISFVDINFATFEHMIVLNNQSVFGDLIYDPTTGARQSRLNIIASLTAGWNGSVDAPGFIINQDNIEEWSSVKRYTKGSIVKYKNVYWQALTIVQPSQIFNYNDWAQSNYNQIQLGLLPNLPNKANQLANSYDINQANIETDNDLLSFGLIGFRPRQYMAALNLDDISQVNVYRQFLGNKGTLQAVDLFKGANLSKEVADYDVYENWAVQRSVYGANANRSFFGLRLNRALLSSNPSVVQVVVPQEVSSADQQILLSDIWRESYKLTSPDILPTTTTLPTDIGLPTAGYVSLDDADITVFDINDTASLNAAIDTIEVGTSIWVAKVNSYDWDIYRAEAVPGIIEHVCDNLDNTSRVIWNDHHGLSVGDKLIIKFFDSEVNGVYSVLSVPNLNTVNITFQFAGNRTVANSQGLGFTLKTMRVAQASDIVNLPYANNILPGAKVWVDDNGAGLWEVLEKQQVFTANSILNPLLLDASEQYGYSVAQARNRIAALVGSPRYGFQTGTARGGVYVYVKNYQDQYSLISPLTGQDAILTLSATGVRGYGNAVDFGDQTWAVAGASKSLDPSGYADSGYACVIYRDPALGQPGVIPYAQWQLLVPDSSTDRESIGEFGYAVSMSADERWMYIGNPGYLPKVHAYGKVDWQNQFINARSNGVTKRYNISGTIQINVNTQIKVTVDNAVQTLGVDYTVHQQSGVFDYVEFTTAPALDSLIVIQRINVQQIDAQTYYNVTQTSTSGSGTGAKFTIVRIRNNVGQPGATNGSVGVTTAGTGYSVGNTITFASSKFGGQANLVLTVSSVNGSGGIVNFSIAYTPVSLTTSFNLSTYFFTATNIYSFSIKVNDVLYRPYYDYTFDDITKIITFTTVPAAGAVIIATAEAYYNYVTSIDAGIVYGSRFGHSLSCSTDGRQVVIGSPYQTVDGKTEAGAVYVFDRNVQRFIYGTDTSSVSFTVLGTVTGPVSVIVNNEFLINQVDSVINGPNTFAVSGNTITINADLQIGDVIEIETNQFKLIQEVDQHTVAEFSNFGQDVDLCAYNCSLYVGEPQSSVQIFKGGIVERSVNQSRLYGTTTAGTANPALTAGNTLRVNNMDVVVPGVINTAISYDKGDVVYNTVGAITTIYQAIQFVPALTPITNTTYWKAVTTTNVAASAIVRALAAQINVTVPNVNATVDTNGYLTVAVKNAASASPTNKVQVAPGSVGTAFTTLAFTTYAWAQNIVSPYPVAQAGFGASLSIDSTATNLVVGAPRGTLYLETQFDDGTTIFDIGSTVFFTNVIQSGAVYTYDYLPSATASISDPGKFVFGDQINNSIVKSLDQFGAAVDYTDGILMVGAPANDFEDSAYSDYGAVFLFTNETRVPAWTVIQIEEPSVDVRLLNSVYLYDRVTGATTEYLDFINPLQGKILGAARSNIDFVGAIDPASYNVGTVNLRGSTWVEGQIGSVWWDTSTVRFIDPNQDNITYASRRWAQIFPGSEVDVYQWIASAVPPSSYAGEGTVYNTLSYSVNSSLTLDGTIATTYYFWVKGITSTNYQLNKTLPVSTVANYITDPRASGIAYLAPINASTIALYNCADLIEAQDTIINIEFDRELTDSNVHVEYELIPSGRADGFLSSNLYRKFQDSFCGVDTFGHQVPDTTLPIAEQFGVQFRPRQSMFVDRFEALKNYLTRVNTVLAQYPIVENRTFTLLNSSEAEPSATSGMWDMRVANLDILSYQNIYAVPLGYTYLVQTDSQNHGWWTIYTVELVPGSSVNRVLVLTRVQNYYTPDYWSYINWYLPGYNSSVRVATEVANYSMLETLSVATGTSVKVTANAQGKWEIYLKTDTGWQRVGLQDGTIEFSAELWDYQLGRFGFDVEVFDAQYFDQEPVIETRKIIQAINEELLIDELAIERNQALILMFNYVLSEFAAPEWLVKTSLIDVDHRLRDLVPYQNYVRDNQEFVSDYIQEVKPYHVSIREFNLRYYGTDTFLGDTTDFDLPAFYNTSLQVPQYTSPILLPYEHGTAFNSIPNTLSDFAANSTVWTSWPYNQWYQNYLLNLESIAIIDGGSNYTVAPNVIIDGDATVPAQAIAVLNSQGRVVAINIVEPGSGYSYTPTIVFDGGNGTGVRAYAVMNRASEAGFLYGRYTGLARSFRTVIKYDRFQYQSQVTEWTANVTYQPDTLVRYDNRVWSADAVVSSATFDLADWTLVAASDLSGVDRTIGYYVPGVNSPGLELPLLIDGVNYPGPQVFGNYFLGDPAALDAVYESEYTDTELGNRITDINVDGGQYIGPFEGHAPEELVNGAEFDTLDMRVYTRPGADWNRDGHSFQIGSVRYTYDPVVNITHSWAGVTEHPFNIIVSNLTTGFDLSQDINYTVDWALQTITIISGVSNGDVVNISVYEIGGGSQLFRANYTGEQAGTSVIIPVNTAEIWDIAVFVDGKYTNVDTHEPYAQSTSWSILDSYLKQDIVNNAGNYYRALQDVPAGVDITNVSYWFAFVPTLETIVYFNQTFTATNGIALLAMGTTTPQQYSWSTAQVQQTIADATLLSTKTITLTNSLQGTNPANLVITRNGLRLRPAEGIEWIGDDSSISFGLPQRGGYQQSIINAPTDVKVWVDNVLQVQSYGSQVGTYSVTNWTGSNTPGRQVVFNTPPAAGARILISVSTVADYLIIDNTAQINVTINLGDVFAITTWNDTSQQNLLTLVFQGPIYISTGATSNEPYDSTVFDSGSVTDAPGSFDYTSGVIIPTNDFNLEREDVNASRLWVTLNGYRLFEGIDYSVQNGYLILNSGAITPTQVLVVTEITNSVVPEAVAFRIFQDMRGVQATYRITPATTTQLAADLSATADIIYVDDVTALSAPALESGIFGVITVNGERIMYRELNPANNTISSLIRGTAGTAAASHTAGTDVYDIGRVNLLPKQFQDYIVQDTSIGDDSTTVFYAPSITIDQFEDSSTENLAVEVYVGGVRQYAYSDTTATSQYRWFVTNYDPVAVDFVVDNNVVPPLVAPAAGVEVTILVRHGVTWYQQGVNTPSNGIALQDTDTDAARFLCGF